MEWLKYPKFIDNNSYIPGRNFDPDSPHPRTDTIAQCGSCGSLFLTRTEWKWTPADTLPFPNRLNIIGIWEEIYHKTSLFNGDPAEYDLDMSTSSCPVCRHQDCVDGKPLLSPNT
jgi:hypothetical protein